MHITLSVAAPDWNIGFLLMSDNLRMLQFFCRVLHTINSLIYHLQCLRFLVTSNILHMGVFCFLPGYITINIIYKCIGINCMDLNSNFLTSSTQVQDHRMPTRMNLKLKWHLNSWITISYRRSLFVSVHAFKYSKLLIADEDTTFVYYMKALSKLPWAVMELPKG